MTKITYPLASCLGLKLTKAEVGDVRKFEVGFGEYARVAVAATANRANGMYSIIY